MSNILIIIVVIVVMFFMFKYGFYYKKQADTFRDRGIITTGVYIGDNVSFGVDRKNRHYKIFEYYIPGGERYTVKAKINSIVIKDNSVNIIYDPQNPNIASVDNFYEREMPWLILILTPTLQIIFIIIFFLLKYSNIIFT